MHVYRRTQIVMALTACLTAACSNDAITGDSAKWSDRLGAGWKVKYPFVVD